jgi:hypothetical protein
MDTIVYNTTTRLSLQATVKILLGGEVKEFKITNERYFGFGRGGGGYINSSAGAGGSIAYGGNGSSSINYTYELREIKSKSSEEIAAEESVVKAKEALMAAENALKVVKEQSK